VLFSGKTLKINERKNNKKEKRLEEINMFKTLPHYMRIFMRCS
jgi:hypothetical protein